MAFARWDLFRDLLTLQEQLDQLSGQTAAGWAPLVDLFETADRFEIVVEVAGLSRDQIRLRVRDGVVTIEGERSLAYAPCEQYHRMERGHGRFVRAFRLNAPIDPDGVTADLRDGVLTVRVPKVLDDPLRIHVS